MRLIAKHEFLMYVFLYLFGCSVLFLFNVLED